MDNFPINPDGSIPQNSDDMDKIKTNSIPILLFVYKRPDHTRKTIKSLGLCDNTQDYDIYVFCDGPKNDNDLNKVIEVRGIIHEFEQTLNALFNKVTIYESEINKGLAASIIGGIDKIMEKYDRAIILEDDIAVSRDFLDFMNEGLRFYEADERVGAISGFSFPIPKCIEDRHSIYKSRTGNSWGWATWKRVWQEADWDVRDYLEFKRNLIQRFRFDCIQKGISNMLDAQMSGDIDSWAVRWDYYFFKNSLYTIYPSRTLVLNNGMDGSGTHCKAEINALGNDESKITDLCGSYQFTGLDSLIDLTIYTANYYFWIKKIQNRFRRFLKIPHYKDDRNR